MKLFKIGDIETGSEFSVYIMLPLIGKVKRANGFGEVFIDCKIELPSMILYTKSSENTEKTKFHAIVISLLGFGLSFNYQKGY